MDIKLVGNRISQQRKKVGLTQEELADMLGISPQAVSKWENGHNLPDIENLMLLAEILKIPYTLLIEDEKGTLDMDFRSRLFHEDNMYTRVKIIAQTEHLTNTLESLVFMREKHAGQYRNGSKFATESVEYINHPLMMCCHACAMGIKDDAILSAILLHDVVEDTDALLDDLPVSDEIKEIVDLVTFKRIEGKTYKECKEIYYNKLKDNKKACIVKIIDRCNNVSTMAGCYNRDRLIKYINETEEFIIPIVNHLKNTEYSDMAFIVKYHIISIVESIKSLL